MKIDIDSQFENFKTLEDLAKKLSIVLNKLQNDLSNQPEFIVVTSEEQEIPKNTPINTIIFKFDEVDIVKTGYYNGEEIILP